jgi:hypothetical protein
MNFSKSKYCSYCQCPKILWLNQYKPEVYVKDTSVEERMSTGNIVGDLAMQLFGEFTEVTAYDTDGKLDISKMIANTDECLKNGTINICEASFAPTGHFCSVDILHKEKDGYAIYEVKSSTHVSPVYITDVAYQKYVLEHCGINVTGTYLVHLNGDYVFDGTLDIHKLFQITDLSAHVAEQYEYAEGNIAAANDIMDDPVEPLYGLSEGCNKPYHCPFWEHCSSHLPKPSVFDVYKIPFATKIDYYNNGIITYEDIKNTREMGNHIRSLQINHELSDLGTYVDKKGIKKFLDNLSFPLYFLDFETMQLPIPQFI